MANSKRHKLVCCLMAMALLLSFFYVVPDPAGRAERGNAAVCVADGQAALTGEMRHEGSWQNMMSAQTLLEARDANPDACTDMFTMIHSVLDEVVMAGAGGHAQPAVQTAGGGYVGDASGMRCLPDSKPPLRMPHDLPLGEYLLYTPDRWKERRLPSELLTYIEKRNDRRQFQ